MSTVLRDARGQLLVLAGLAALLATVPFWLEGSARTVMIRIIISAGVGVGWNVMGGFAGQFSFGHAAYFGIGAYSSAYLLVDHGISPWIGMAVGAVLAAAFGALTGWLSFRYRLRGAYFALATFAFAEMLRLVVQGQEWLNGTQGLQVPVLAESSWWMLQFSTTSPNYFLVGLGLLVVLQAITILLFHGRRGMFIVAVREDEEGAEASGVDATAHKVMAVAVSGAMTAVMGTFFVQVFFFIDPALAFGPAESVAILLPAVVGGTGTLWGPIVGAAILIPLGEWTSKIVRDPPPFLDFVAGRSGIDLMVFATLLILILLFLPKGVYGSLAERFRR
ncbi:branched-chain amino acid ABC transporter permease [Salsipaludibacter albus]|uniref:branched-chain amino acid ABC transporter permease n=1 Tax=Salsipaludibacter albus TaxID=2849650 RepID=UPI001EE3D7BC|nr:branched-chain amino acid ABC transporter permease [Salsipaludibacter albus]MBY5162121.1 branched-chain amino acid ABC transporter permease [Salsipaludibacter albus]